MKDLLTTSASVIVILFCASVLFLTDDKALSEPEAELLTQFNAAQLNKPLHPLAKTTLYHRVQDVKVEKGVLKFVTADQDGLKEHYFLLRDKNVILAQKDGADMPHNSIQFYDDGHRTLEITIPTTFNLDLMHQLTASN